MKGAFVQQYFSPFKNILPSEDLSVFDPNWSHFASSKEKKSDSGEKSKIFMPKLF